MFIHMYMSICINIDLYLHVCKNRSGLLTTHMNVSLARKLQTIAMAYQG